MTGYERCLAVINGEIPDRVPAYTPTVASDVAGDILGRTAHTGGPGLWYAEACAWCDGPDAWQDFNEQVTEDTIKLHEALSQDVIRFPWRRNIRPASRVDENTFICGDPCGEHQVWKWDASSMNFVCSKEGPKARVEDWPEMAKKAKEGVEERIPRVRETAGIREAELQERLGTSMLVAAAGPGLSLGLTEEALMAAVLEQEAVADILDCSLEIGLAQLEGIAGRGIKVVLGGGDMADKNGPIYSPELFRTLMLPRWKKLANRSRELGLHYVWRSDGNLWKVADMLFVEAGMPGYGEVDYDATMTVPRIRERYPDLTIWANLSGDLIRRGTAEDVYRHSMELLEAGGGRRYFHGCSNTILPGTPIENVKAMMQARDDFTPRIHA